MLKYICLSDQHAGAKMSLLTELASDSFRAKSKVTSAFGTALNEFLSQQQAKPQLIILGDLLDLQFSKRSRAAFSATHYLSALKEGGLIDDELIATAGNHDHALWTDARLKLEADQIAPPDKSGSLGPIEYRTITKAFEPNTDADSRLLTNIAQAAGFKTVDLRYPNIAFGDRERTVMLHHGHFIERPYSIISRFKDFLTGQKRQFLTAQEIATENAGWLDFFWSALGESTLESEAYDVYQNLLTISGYRNKSADWAAEIAENLSEALPLSGNLTIQSLLRKMTQVGFDVTLEKFADTERASEVHSLTSDAWDGLKNYLEGPAAQQIDEELQSDADPKEPVFARDLTFIFGHTHKPFVDRLVSTASQSPIKIFNTGGWVLNGPRLNTRAGAAMVLIDDALNVVSVPLFGTPQNGQMPPNTVQVLSGSDDGARAFAAEVQKWLDATHIHWATLSQEAQSAYDLRQRYLLDLTNPEKVTS